MNMKKKLKFKAKVWYFTAISLGIASLMVASGVETADTFNGMIAYSLAAVGVFALTLPCVECARRLEIEADRIGRPVHREHARPDQRKGA